MSIIIKLLSPILMKIAEVTLGVLFRTISTAIDEWMAKRKEADDDRRIDDAFKKPDRGRAARDLNDVFKGQ